LFLAVGSFTSDGQGHLGGTQDVSRAGSQGSTSGTRFAGSYAIGQDGRGNATFGLQGGCPNWQITMLSHAHALLTCLNSNITASGSIDLQDSSAFNVAALKGSYVFSFSGLGVTNASTVMAGNWTMDGTGVVTRGQMDVNDLGAATAQNLQIAGNYSVSSTGRGTATISSNYSSTPQTLVFYVVNGSDLKVLESDASAAISGEVLRQAPGPLTPASFNGTHAFTLGGIDVNGDPLAMGGLLTANGTGSISSGVLDLNYSGTLSLGQVVTGSYSVSSTGRGSAILNSSLGQLPIAFYIAENGTVEIVNTGGNLGGLAFLAGGAGQRQAAGPFTDASIAGNYGVNFTGTNFDSGQEEDISGQFAADGAGTLSGVLDVNNGGNVVSNLPLSSSTYTVAASGRGSASFNVSTGSFAMQTYQISPIALLTLGTDPNRVLVGIAQQQQF
jgi:hypothetical protein